MERELEQQLYRMQADLCQVLADPTRLELLALLGEGPRAVKELVEATG
jgi:DNA-binding transcriptional ArsR family regulator